MTITIYGASDDLVEVSGCEGADEFYLPSGDHWQCDLTGPGPGGPETMRVNVRYDPDASGAWVVAPGLASEDASIPYPAWPVRLRRGSQDEADYSMVLEIDAPEGTRLDNVAPKRD